MPALPAHRLLWGRHPLLPPLSLPALSAVATLQGEGHPQKAGGMAQPADTMEGILSSAPPWCPFLGLSTREWGKLALGLPQARRKPQAEVGRTDENKGILFFYFYFFKYYKYFNGGIYKMVCKPIVL